MKTQLIQMAKRFSILFLLVSSWSSPLRIFSEAICTKLRAGDDPDIDDSDDDEHETIDRGEATFGRSDDCTW